MLNIPEVTKREDIWVGSPSLVVIEGDFYSKRCEFESQHWIADNQLSNLFVRKWYRRFKRPIIKQKKKPGMMAQQTIYTLKKMTVLPIWGH